MYYVGTFTFNKMYYVPVDRNIVSKSARTIIKNYYTLGFDFSIYILIQYI